MVSCWSLLDKLYKITENVRFKTVLRNVFFLKTRKYFSFAQ